MSALTRYYKVFPQGGPEGSCILFSTKNAAAIKLSGAMLQDIRCDRIEPKDRTVLENLGFLVPDAGQEAAGMLHFVDELNALSKKISLIVVLNFSCNLACTYCFEGAMKGPHYMSMETARQLLDFIECMDTRGKEELQVSFYGGEPLLSADMLTHISTELMRVSARKGLRYRFTMVTNGTLLSPQRAQQLKDIGLQGVKVTLDGPKHVHDASRPFRSGAGSFDTIVENLKQVYRITGVRLGGNYTRANYRYFPGLLDVLIEEGLTPEVIRSIKFDPVTAGTGSPESQRLSGVGAHHDAFAVPEYSEGCQSINEPWIQEASVFLRKQILTKGFNTPPIAPARCIVESTHTYVVHYDGMLYKCPGFIGKKGFEIGTLADGVKDYSGVYALGNWKNEECLSCAYLPLCFGGCRYMRLIAKGDIDGTDCRRDYYDAVLKELVLQDFTLRHR